MSSWHLSMPYTNNVWYHVTHRDNLRSIRDHGLVPTNRGIGNERNWQEYSIVTGGVYLHPTVSAAEAIHRSPDNSLSRSTGWSERDLVILQVSGLDQRRLHPDPEILTHRLDWYMEDSDDIPEYDALIPLLRVLWEEHLDAYLDTAGQKVWDAYLSLSLSQQEAIKDIYPDLDASGAWVYLGTIPAQSISLAQESERDYQYVGDMQYDFLTDQDDEYIDYYEYRPLMGKEGASNLPEGVSFSEHWGDAVGSNQYDQILVAKLDGVNIGAIHVAHVGDDIFIQNIEVLPEYRRMGVATALYSYVQERNPESTIHHTNTTDDGTAWKRSLAWNIPDDENEWDYWTQHDEELPERLYHVAPTKFREDILKEGLYPKETWNTGADQYWDPEDEQNYTVNDDGEYYAYEWRPSAVYLWQRLEDAQRYAGPEDDIWEIDPSEFYGDNVRRDPASAMNWKFLEPEHQTLMVESVSPESIRLFEQGETKGAAQVREFGRVESMAQRSGDPELDALIEQFIKLNPSLDPGDQHCWEHMSVSDMSPDEEGPNGYGLGKGFDPEGPEGFCLLASRILAVFLQEHGVQADVLIMHDSFNPFDQMGYADRGRTNPDIPGHAVVHVEINGHEYTIDFTAGQYGYTEWPMVQRLDRDSERWQRRWDNKTAAGNLPYWWEDNPSPDSMLQYAEYVPIDQLLPALEYDRRPGAGKLVGGVAQAADQDYWDQLKQHLAQHGMQSPIWLNYNADSGEAYVGEGNHRIRAALELGWTHVPTILYHSRRGVIRPSDVGLPVREVNPREAKVSATEKLKLYHITDRNNFTLDPDFEPQDNTFAIEDRSGRKGIYLTDSPDSWRAQGYYRPYVAEITVPDGLARPERWGREMFLPAEHFDKAEVTRVIPFDVYHKQTYPGTEVGQIEEHAGTPPSTGDADDARLFTPEQHIEHLTRLRDMLHDVHGWGWNEFDDQGKHIGVEEVDDEGMPVRRDRDGNVMTRDRYARGPQSPLRVANILDPISDTLCPNVFDRPADVDPDVKPEIIEWVKIQIYDAMVEAGWPDPSQEQYLNLVLTGSLCTYQYNEGPENASDFDVSVFVDAERFPDWVRAELIAILVHKLGGITVPGTSHPLEIYVVPQEVHRDDLYKPGLRSAYDLDLRKWIVLPDKEMSVDVRLQMPELVTYAQMQTDKLRTLLRYNPAAAALHFKRLQDNRRSSMASGAGNLTPINVAWKWIEAEGLDKAGKKAVKDFLGGDRPVLPKLRLGNR